MAPTTIPVTRSASAEKHTTGRQVWGGGGRSSFPRSTRAASSQGQYEVLGRLIFRARRGFAGFDIFRVSATRIPDHVLGQGSRVVRAHDGGRGWREGEVDHRFVSKPLSRRGIG